MVLGTRSSYASAVLPLRVLKVRHGMLWCNCGFTWLIDSMNLCLVVWLMAVSMAVAEAVNPETLVEAKMYSPRQQQKLPAVLIMVQLLPGLLLWQ